MSQALVKLGLKPGAAGNHQTARKYIDQLGLNTDHWTGRAWVGTRNLKPTEARPLEEIMVEGSSYATSHLRRRLISSGRKERRCEGCKLTEWRGEPIPLELEHVNGISNDHRWENLQLLCPNCHALTPTWRGRKNLKIKKTTIEPT